MIKAFIFDFDGLILDTEDACYQAWQEIYKKFGASLPLDKWLLCIGTSDDACDPIGILASATNFQIDHAEIRADHSKRYREKTRLLTPKAGVIEFLKWAKSNGFQTAIASSSIRNWVESHLQDLGIRYLFDIVLTKDDVSTVKPNPELFISAKSKLNLLDYEAVIFEDSYNGIVAGNQANLYTVAIPNRMTKNMDFSAANLVLKSLNAITPLNLLKTLENGAQDT